jgi:uncharacterized phage protein (TIGR01671 family)
MREILFRGKKKHKGGWAEGSLITAFEYICILQSENKVHPMDYPYLDGDSGVIDGEATPVIPETVGQYTGLTDKNGKKIFEGDIVKYGDTVHEVVFEQRNNTAYFGLVYNELETLPFGHYQELKQIEIIGNIHDNPELLGGESDD